MTSLLITIFAVVIIVIYANSLISTDQTYVEMKNTQSEIVNNNINFNNGLWSFIDSLISFIGNIFTLIFSYITAMFGITSLFPEELFPIFMIAMICVLIGIVCLVWGNR